MLSFCIFAAMQHAYFFAATQISSSPDHAILANRYNKERAWLYECVHAVLQLIIHESHNSGHLTDKKGAQKKNKKLSPREECRADRLMEGLCWDWLLAPQLGSYKSFFQNETRYSAVCPFPWLFPWHSLRTFVCLCTVERANQEPCACTLQCETRTKPKNLTRSENCNGLGIYSFLATS